MSSDRERKRKWRIKRYWELVNDLEQLVGATCEECGVMIGLVFDHPYGRDYDPGKLDRVTRLKRYMADWINGNLRRLCDDCNKIMRGCIQEVCDW